MESVIKTESYFKFSFGEDDLSFTCPRSKGQYKIMVLQENGSYLTYSAVVRDENTVEIKVI